MEEVRRKMEEMRWTVEDECKDERAEDERMEEEVRGVEECGREEEESVDAMVWREEEELGPIMELA